MGAAGRIYLATREGNTFVFKHGRELEILQAYKGRVPDRLFTEEYTLPVTDGSGNNRAGLRRALGLLRDAILQLKEQERTATRARCRRTGRPPTT